MTVLATLPLASQPGSLSVSPTTGHVFVTLPVAGRIAVLDGAARGVPALLPMRATPLLLVATSATGRIYVAGGGQDTLVPVPDRRLQSAWFP